MDDKLSDAIGQFIGLLHDAIGHDATQRFLGVTAFDKRYCILCHPELAATHDHAHDTS
jgi:hypothetical protein